MIDGHNLEGVHLAVLVLDRDVFADLEGMRAETVAGFVILVQFNAFAIAMGVASLILIAIYPFMKRVTWWPQFFLGLAFNWGALLGWAAVTGSLSFAPAVLYAGGIFWTLGYDTIYALQDKEDDALVGIKSTARRLAADMTGWITFFYVCTSALFALAGYLAGAHWAFYLGLGAGAAHMMWQVRTLDADSPARCLRLFRSNRDYGYLVFAGIVAASMAANWG